MSSGQASANTAKWMSYLADNVFGDMEDPQGPGSLFWPHQQTTEGMSSQDDGPVKAESSEGGREGSWSKKRSRDDGKDGGFGSKATREKQRRDRLNDRFVELSHALEPGKPPKSDKATILCDAVKVLSQLRKETVQLKEDNEQLKEQIKELKVEKNELRDEKSRLKSEKEMLEQHVKAMTVSPGFMPHPTAMQAAAAAFAAQAQAAQAAAQMGNKNPQSNHSGAYGPGFGMFSWLPPSARDTSQDHTKHPPVA